MKKKGNRRSFLKQVTISGLGVATMPGLLLNPAIDQPLLKDTTSLALNKNAANEELNCWLESSLKRVFPQSPSGTAGKLDILTARNCRIAFQACFHNNSANIKHITCSVEGAGELKPVIRYVGLVPMHHFTPDTKT
jgi:hypothetical protein